jgi:glutaredoxin 3
MDHKVIIYTTPSCVYCKMTKEFFAKNNVQYEERNVATDMQAREEMLDKSQQLGVPVIDVDGTIIIGFDKKNLETALGLGAAAAK